MTPFPPKAKGRGATAFSRGDRQIAVRALVATVALAGASVLVLLVALTFETKWVPALSVDNSARDSLHRFGLAHRSFTAVMEAVSAVSGALGWQLVSVVLIGWLLWQRRVRAAVFVVVGNAGSSLLNTALKGLVHRHRPVVTHPFLHAPGQSFPSGHAQAAAAGFTVLLFVLWPHLRSGWWRRAVIGVAVAACALIGFSRVELAAHFVSDVVAGYLVGVAWVVVIAAALHVWRPTGRLAQPGRGPRQDA